jgi:hypothetical protein
MRRQIAVLLALLAGCAGGCGSGGGGSGDASAGADGSGSPAAYNETEPPAATMVTPQAGGSVTSAAGLLKVTFRPNALAQPTEMRVVRLTGADVPADAFLGIAHRVEPVLPYYNTVAEATWTIPGALVGAAFGAPASSSRAPLPVARMISAIGGKADEALYVSRYQVLEGGGLELRANVSSPTTALYLSKSYSVAQVTGVAPTPNMPGGADFTIKPAPGSDMIWLSGTIGSTSTNNWESGGSTVESDGNQGLVGRFGGTCDFGGYPARLSFEVKGKLTVGGRSLGYDATLGTTVTCPR